MKFTRARGMAVYDQEIDMATEDDPRQPSQRIADDMTLAVVAGAISPGDKLPSTTELMAEYEVANQTVQNAFRILKDTGLIYTIKGTGTFVRSDINPEDFKGEVQAGSPLFRQILSRLDTIGDEITGINARLAQLESDRQSERD